MPNLVNFGEGLEMSASGEDESNSCLENIGALYRWTLSICSCQLVVKMKVIAVSKT